MEIVLTNPVPRVSHLPASCSEREETIIIIIIY